MNEETMALPNPFAVANDPNDSPDLELLTRETDGNDERRPFSFPVFYPLAYHNISLEIPQKYSFIVRLSYYSAYSIVFSMFFSFLASLMTTLREVFLSFTWMILYSFLFLYVQYYPLYTSIKSEIPSQKIVPVQYAMIFFLLPLVIGLPGTGMIGFVYLSNAYSLGSSFSIMLSFIISIWNTINIVSEIAILFLIVPLFTLSGRISNPADL